MKSLVIGVESRNKEHLYFSCKGFYAGKNSKCPKGYVEVTGDETPFDHSLLIDDWWVNGVTARHLPNQSGYEEYPNMRRLFVRKSTIKRALNEMRPIFIDFRGNPENRINRYF